MRTSISLVVVFLTSAGSVVGQPLFVQPDAPPPSAVTDPNVPGIQVTSVAVGNPASETISEEYLPDDVGRHFLSIPSLLGPVGLFRMSTAETGPVNHLRLSFRSEYFAADNVLIKKDYNQRLQGTFSIGYTPIEHLEVFGALLASSNRNLRLCEANVCISEPDRVDPELIKSIGDIVLGAKYAQPVSRGLSFGGEAGIKLLASINGLSLNPRATSLWFSGMGTGDLREFAQVPVRLHVNLGYYFDNSENLINYRNVSQASQLVSSFAFGIGKDRFRTAFGVDLPFDPVAPDVYILPFAEYHIDVVTAERDPNFANFARPRCVMSSAPADRCVDNRDQQWLTLGVRALLPRGWSADIGLDIGIRSPGFPYGVPLPPYNVLAGVTLPLDLNRMGKVRKVTRTKVVEKEVATTPPEGIVTGSVVNAAGGIPIGGAIVGVIGRPQARVATDPDGTFQSHPLPPGEVDLEISAPDFEPQVVRAEIAASMSTEVRVALVSRTTDVEVSGRLVDEKGAGIAGSVRFVGPSLESAAADASGAFRVRVSPGMYRVLAVADGYLQRELELNVRTGFTAPADFVLRKRTGPPSVRLVGKRIALRGMIDFRGETDQLTVRAQAILAEVAALLAEKPEILLLDIETHYDSSPGPQRAMQLTERRAEAIAAYLRDQGVTAGRLRTSPKGDTQPVVPNIGEKNRNRNRRVELRVQFGS